MNQPTDKLLTHIKSNAAVISEYSEMEKEIQKINEDIKDLNQDIEKSNASISNNKFVIDTLCNDLNDTIKSNNKKFENLYNKNISINQCIFIIFIVIIILISVFSYQFNKLNKRIESLESTYEISETLPNDTEQ